MMQDSELARLAADFARDGAVVVRGALGPAVIERLRAGIEANLAAPSPRAKVASSPEDPGYFVEDFCNWQDNVDYRAVIDQSPLPRLAAALMGSATARLYHDHMLTKAAGTRQPTPWHQDQPYYNIDGRQTVSFWIPADPVPRESTLEFVAASHRGPWLMPRSFMDDQAKWFPAGTLAELPDIDADPVRYPVLGWAVEPGDVLAFNMLALHRAAGSASRRRVLSLRFIGDDVRHAPRGWATSPDFPGLAERLPAGAVMDDPLFPLVWAHDAPKEIAA
ncbi:MAG: phytanoyl-CoA dioxygenase family protein [Proteobacteria bacterium]|nr:phytanoyl-CoA dioxygenase family protein [Pseudomonadota bacterium]